MSNNSNSSEGGGELVNSGYFRYILVSCGEGFIGALPNLLLATVILRFKQLRTDKSMWAILGLAIADALNGMAYFHAGIHRLFWFERLSTIQIMPVECLIQPYALNWLWSSPMSTFMLSVVSLDRLLAVALPIRYYQLGIRYGYAIVGIPFTMGALLALEGVRQLVFYDADILESNGCFGLACGGGCFQLRGLFAWWFFISPALFALSSVILYVGVVIFYIKKGAQVSALGDSAVQHHMKKQRELTKNVGIITCFTLILVVIPVILNEVGVLSRTKLFLGIPQFLYTFILWNLNPFPNLYIYITHQGDIRKGIIALFQGKPTF